MSFQCLVSCSSLAVARKYRRAIAAKFGIPSAALLAQFDVSRRDKVPVILYCPALHRRLDAKRQGLVPPQHDDEEQDGGVLQHLRDKVNLFLNGYNAGRRSVR